MQRYIIKELASSFFLCLFSLLALILIGRGLQMRNLFIGLDLSAVDTALLFFYMMPMFMLIVVPLSCMLSVFLTFLRMSTDRELVALKAGGVSLYQLLIAPLSFCALCAIFNLFISLHGVAWGMGNFRSTIMEIAHNRAKVVIQPGVFNQDIPGLTLFARQVDPDTQEMYNVIFEDRTQDKDNRLTIFAKRGTISTEVSTSSLLFLLRDGTIYREDGNQLGVLGFDEYEVRLDLSKVFNNVDLGEVRPKEMSWDELRTLQRTPPKKSSERSLQRLMLKVGTELEKRRALPAACIVLGLFAMPLACMFEGVRKQMGVVLSLVMFFVYYSFFSLGVTISESGTVSALIGLWAPNVFFGVLGIAGLYFTARERVPTFQMLRISTPFSSKKNRQDDNGGAH